MTGLYYADAVLFGAASLGGIGGIYSQRPFWRGLARVGWLAGTVTAVGLLVALTVSAGRAPGATLSETLLCMVLALSLLTFAMERWLRTASLHSFMLPLSFVLTVTAAAVAGSGRVWGPGGALALIHGWSSILGLSAFAAAFLAAVMYVVQESLLRRKNAGPLFHALPPLERLDRIHYRSVAFGFPFFTLAIVAGALWARHRWEERWLAEPVVIGSFVVWGIYAVLLWGQMGAKWHGRRSAYVVILGFLIGMASLFGTAAIGGAH